MNKYPPVPISSFYGYVESLKKDNDKLFKEQFEVSSNNSYNKKNE